MACLKHEKDERSILYGYLDNNHCIYSYGEAQNEANELEAILANLQSCDFPDMYAIVGRTLVIIEHFAFDASRETKRGGMEQIRKDRRAKAEMEEEIKSGKTEAMVVERVGAEPTFFDWKLNFENHFDSHYAKIDRYIENAKNEVCKNQLVKAGTLDSYRVGFFIEEEFPPIVEIGEKQHELHYSETKQFLDFYSGKSRVDFILFGTYHGGCPRLIYVDHSHTIDTCKAVDLQADDVRMSRINKNEVVVRFVVKI